MGRRRKKKPLSQKDKMKIRRDTPKTRNEIMRDHIENTPNAGPMKEDSRVRDVAKGRRRPKHKKKWDEDRDGGADFEALANAELQSSFYKTLEGEPLQVTPLRTQPDYGEVDYHEERQMMNLEDVLKSLEKEDELSLSKMATALKTVKKRPSGGLYGYTKQTQRDVLASVRKVQKVANKIARTIYAKDRATFAFLDLHAERSNSLSARILCAAMENIGPKVASTKRMVKNDELGATIDAAIKKSRPKSDVSLIIAAANGNGSVTFYSEPNGIQAEKDAKAFAKQIEKDGVKTKAESLGGGTSKWKVSLTSTKKASTKIAAGHGMYGYRVKTAKLALQACLDISQEAGSVAYDLHTRRTAKYEKITSFLRDHSKRGRCRFARILLRFYPEAASLVTASDKEDEKEADEKEAKHEKGKKVPLSKMPEELAANAKDPSKHIKAARLMKRQEKVLEKYLASGGNAMSYDDLPRNVRASLERIKDTETLWSDVERWLSDNNNPHLKSMWANKLIAQAEAILKAAGCENLPNEAMQEACEAKKKDGDKEGEDDEDGKTAGCENLPNEAMQEACEAKKKDGDKEGEDEDEDGKTAGCEKLPPALKENCEKKKSEGKEGEDDEDEGKKAAAKDDDTEDEESGDPAIVAEKDSGLLGTPVVKAIKDGLNPKKASRVRLTTRIANGELQRGRVMFGAEDDEDEDKEGEGMGRSQLPGEDESNEAQPKLEGNSGYNPGATEFNGTTTPPKQAAEDSELKEKAEGHSTLPNDEDSNKVQPDMGQHGYEAGHAVKVGNEYVTYTSVTDLPDGAQIIWVD